MAFRLLIATARDDPVVLRPKCRRRRKRWKRVRNFALPGKLDQIPNPTLDGCGRESSILTMEDGVHVLSRAQRDPNLVVDPRSRNQSDAVTREDRRNGSLGGT